MGKRLKSYYFSGICWIFSFLLFSQVQKLYRKTENSNIRLSSPYLCHYNVSTFGGGSERDVIFLYGTGYKYGLELTIRSIRSAGCKCRIVFIYPSSFHPEGEFKDILKSLKVECIETPEEDPLQRIDVPHMIRYEYEKIWLDNHINEVDRVLHTDSYDVFFQGCPFAQSIDNNPIPFDSLIFVVEPHCFRSCGWNLAWMESCYGHEITISHRHNFIICSGSIAGGAKPYQKLLNLLIEQPQWESCWNISLDQPILNHLMWTGKIKEAGINYQLTGCNGGFFTMQWCIVERDVQFNEKGQIISLEGSVPSFIHQYNRIYGLETNFWRACHMNIPGLYD